MSQAISQAVSQAVPQAQSLELFDAIEQGDFGRVWRLVKAKRGLQDEDPESGLTPLALAAELGHTEVVRILLENEVDPNWGGSVTPLEAAVLEGNPGIVDLLIEAGADVNRPVEEGFTPLMSAVSVGNARIARRLLDAGAKTRLKNADGDTALDLAEAAGYDKLAELLRSHRPKPRPVPEEFLRPLELPKSKQDFDMPHAPAPGPRPTAMPAWVQPDVEQVAAALGSSARPAPKATTQPAAKRPAIVDTPSAPAWSRAERSSARTSQAASSSSEPVSSEPQSSKPQSSRPQSSAPELSETQSSEPSTDLAGIERFDSRLKANEVDEALSMFAKGLVGVDERDRKGRTVLMLAAEHGAEALVDALLATGADVSARDDGESRDTALIYAIRHEGGARKAIVRKLVEAGADLDTRHGAKGLTPLMEAAKTDVFGEVGSPTDFAPVTKLLIELGANLEAQDALGNTVWQMIKRAAMAALTSSPYRRRLHQMLRVLESAGSHQMSGRL